MSARALPALLTAALAACAGPSTGGRVASSGAPADFGLTVASEETLRRLQREIDRRQWELAVEAMDELAARGRGVLAQPDAGRERWVYVWDLVHTPTVPTELMGAYRRKHDAGAAEAFESAWKRGDWAECSDLVDRHSLATGFSERAARLAAAALEAGEFEAAARLGERGLRGPPEKWAPAVVARTAVALALGGRREALRKLHEQAGDAGRLEEWVQIGDERELLSELFIKLERDPPDLPVAPVARAPRDYFCVPSGGGEAREEWRLGELTLALVRPSRDARAYALVRESGRGGWSVELCRLSGAADGAPSIAWLRNGTFRLLIEGRLLFTIEPMTGRIGSVVGATEILDPRR